jgi:hypothetical protein
MADVIHLYQDWTDREGEALINLFLDLQARGVADSWEKALTDIGEPQFYLFSNHCPETVLAISRIWHDGKRIYLVESRHGHPLAAEPELETAIYKTCHQRQSDAKRTTGEIGFLQAMVGAFGVAAAEVLALAGTEFTVDDSLLEAAGWLFPIVGA